MPLLFAALSVAGGALVVIGIILSFYNWGKPVPIFGGITEFLVELPFHPKANPHGMYPWSELALTAGMNVATWAALAASLAAAIITALTGFIRTRAVGIFRGDETRR
jgi:hypothetical protein